MKSVFTSRRNKNPHTNEGKERKETPFFAKESKKPFFNVANRGAVQTKLTVGQPDDKYEKEADHMADAVVNNSSKPEIQNKEISSIQRESLATPQEDEKLGTAEQRVEEDKLVQEKPEIQKMEKPEEEEAVQKMEGEEEEETVQTKNESGTQIASAGLSNTIKSKAGTGRKMSPQIKAEMESGFGSDFSTVNIHTDQDAIGMNKQLGAQAFTHGKDIYFNSGKYNPDTTQGKRLLAHELTHVVQQSKEKKISPKIQRMLACPSTLRANDPVPTGFKEYQGFSSVFHCGYRGILEDRSPTPSDPQNECFYDTLGRLVDQNHDNADCRGTPNDYDSSESKWDHTFNDRGGIWHRGWDSFWGSRNSRDDRTDNQKRQDQEQCVVRLGGCPHTRPAGIPTTEEIRNYNATCRNETYYRGSDITPDCNQ